MTSTSFFYWLQGFFELGADGQRIGFTTKQAECIWSHLELVTNPEPRIFEIRALLRMLLSPVETEPPQGSMLITDEIRAIVAAQFEHVIDPAAGGPEAQTTLNQIHSGPNLPPGVLARC